MSPSRPTAASSSAPTTRWRSTSSRTCIEELAPPRQEFKFYELKNSDCRDVWYNLKDYFKDELAASDDDNWFRMFGTASTRRTKPPRSASAASCDSSGTPATNSILVQNASPAQIQVIDKLIEIYDQPVAEDAVRKRRTEIVQVKYSRARTLPPRSRRCTAIC